MQTRGMIIRATMLLAAGVLAAGLMAQNAQTKTPGQKGGRAKVTIPASVEANWDVVFGTGGGRELKLNVFMPKQRDGLRPAVVFIHGGGWRNGGPTQFQNQAIHLAENGYVCACSEYRLSGEAKFPAALEDSKCAVRWMRANAEELGVNKDRVAVSGGSAGGHLAAMIALTGPGLYEGEGGHQDQSSNANCAVLFNPVADLWQMGKDNQGTAMLAAFLGKKFSEDEELYRQASPVTYAGEGDPPTLVLHGTKDTTVPYAHAEAMVQKLKDAGVPAELFPAEGAAHAFFNKEPWYTPTVKAMDEFLAKHLQETK